MKDPRIAVDLQDEYTLELVGAELSKHLEDAKAEVVRGEIMSIIESDSEPVRDVQADALMDAAEVIRLRIEKKVAPMLAMESRPGMSGYMGKVFAMGGRATVALTIEGIMLRWLTARAEAVRSE